MSELRDLYQEVILDHVKRPRNFGHGLALDRLGHQRGRGDRNGTTSALKSRIHDLIIGDREEDCHNVAAKRIVTHRLMTGCEDRAEIPRSFDMIQDHFLIEIAEFAHSRNTSWTLRRPATKASTSSRSL